jgi:hypothetical protein
LGLTHTWASHTNRIDQEGAVMAKKKKKISSEKAAHIAGAAAELALAIEARHLTKKNGCYPAPTPVVFEALTPKGFVSKIIDAARWEVGYQGELKWFQHDGDGSS